MPKAKRVFSTVTRKLKVGDLVVASSCEARRACIGMSTDWNVARWDPQEKKWSFQYMLRFGAYKYSNDQTNTIHEFLILKVFGETNEIANKWWRNSSQYVSIFEVRLPSGEVVTIGRNSSLPCFTKNPNYEEEKDLQCQWKLDNNWYEWKKQRRARFKKDRRNNVPFKYRLKPYQR